MYQYKGMDDTIAAISTPVGQGGIGIVRISGQDAIDIADKIFLPKNGKKISSADGFTVHYGNVLSNDEVIDEALLTLMRSPKSYTTEDVVEISCHGGIAAIRAVLSLAIDNGARLAEPGEFTKRAFINGRIDLAQAEAVLDIIQSNTEAFLKVSTNQLKGELSKELDVIREGLMNVYTAIEAIVNFPEDDMDESQREEIADNIQGNIKKIDNLLEGSDQGMILREGIKIVICGKPNVGKSSLLNALLKAPRAIVSDIAGTTRDTLEETTQIGDIPFSIVDTAGILNPRDVIEKEAVERSRKYIDSADQVLLMIDINQELSKEDIDLIEAVKGKNTLVLLSKNDLDTKLALKDIHDFLVEKDTLRISVVTKEGLDSLKQRIVDNVLHGKTISTHGVLVNNLRHVDALNLCRASADRSWEILKGNISLEFVSEEIKNAVNHLDSITGRNVDADLIENIFSRFCIGK